MIKLILKEELFIWYVSFFSRVVIVLDILFNCVVPIGLFTNTFSQLILILLPVLFVYLNPSTVISNSLILFEKLRLFFDDTSRQKLLERRGAESDAMQTELNKIPFVIYIA